MIETLFAEEARWPVLIGMLLGTVKRLGAGSYSQVGGGIGIEQLSGPEAELAVARRIWRGRSAPRRNHHIRRALFMMATVQAELD
jgi:hypothetical protein